MVTPDSPANEAAPEGVHSHTGVIAIHAQACARIGPLIAALSMAAVAVPAASALRDHSQDFRGQVVSTHQHPKTVHTLGGGHGWLARKHGARELAPESDQLGRRGVHIVRAGIGP